MRRMMKVEQPEDQHKFLADAADGELYGLRDDYGYAGPTVREIWYTVRDEIGAKLVLRGWIECGSPKAGSNSFYYRLTDKGHEAYKQISVCGDDDG